MQERLNRVILGPGQNLYLYLHPKTRQFVFIPWDHDNSFGQFDMVGTQEQRESLSIHKPWTGQNLFLERVFKVAKFKALYLAKLREFSETIFKPERFHHQVDEIAAAIQPAVQEESAEKLARFDKVVAGEPVGPAGFGGGFGRPRNDGDRAPSARPPGGEDGPRFGGGFGGPGQPGPGGQGPPFGFPGGFGQPPKPIKGFVTARAKSVNDQLAGRAQGATVARPGFGGPGGPGRQGGPGGPGGPGDFGPGMFLGPAFVAALDADKNGKVTQAEFIQSFQRWFNSWNSDQSGVLTDDQLRAGINKDLSPFRVGPLAGFGFGPPGGPPP